MFFVAVVFFFASDVYIVYSSCLLFCKCCMYILSVAVIFSPASAVYIIYDSCLLSRVLYILSIAVVFPFVSDVFTIYSKEPMSFVKSNLFTFMECQDALVTMHNKLTWDENQKLMSLDKLNMLLQGLSNLIE